VKYLEFKAVDGSFVVRDKRVHKVPANDMEALKSPLMGIFEKCDAAADALLLLTRCAARAGTDGARGLSRAVRVVVRQAPRARLLRVRAGLQRAGPAHLAGTRTL
jgi:hypothetical protein